MKKELKNHVALDKNEKIINANFMTPKETLKEGAYTGELIANSANGSLVFRTIYQGKQVNNADQNYVNSYLLASVKNVSFDVRIPLSRDFYKKVGETSEGYPIFQPDFEKIESSFTEGQIVSFTVTKPKDSQYSTIELTQVGKNKEVETQVLTTP